jgi:hypothetical protein
VNAIVGHLDELDGAVHGEDFLNVLLVNVAGQAADMNFSRARRGAALSLLVLFAEKEQQKKRDFLLLYIPRTSTSEPFYQNLFHQGMVNFYFTSDFIGIFWHKI